MLLQHDIAQSHTSRATAAKISDIQFQFILHPSYSPDLVPGDYHLFRLLKKALGGKKFSTKDELKTAVHTWLCNRAKDSIILAEGMILNSNDSFSLVCICILSIKNIKVNFDPTSYI